MIPYGCIDWVHLREDSTLARYSEQTFACSEWCASHPTPWLGAFNLLWTAIKSDKMAVVHVLFLVNLLVSRNSCDHSGCRTTQNNCP